MGGPLNTLKCNCSEKGVILNEIQNPENVLSLEIFRLLFIHPDNPAKFFYQCTACGQVWEKMSRPHHYGYSETWKKLENIPHIPPKQDD